MLNLNIKLVLVAIYCIVSIVLICNITEAYYDRNVIRGLAWGPILQAGITCLSSLLLFFFLEKSEKRFYIGFQIGLFSIFVSMILIFLFCDLTQVRNMLYYMGKESRFIIESLFFIIIFWVATYRLRKNDPCAKIGS